MILTVTIDNRTVSFAFFGEDGKDVPLRVFRIAANPTRTADEYAALLCAMPAGERTGEVKRAIVASVVPSLTPQIVRAVELLYPQAVCLTLGAGLRTGMLLRVDTPAELGADLVAMAAGAVKHQAPPLLVLHCGDVTTLSAIGVENGTPVYLGCAILPAPTLSVQALKGQAALLSAVELSRPAHAIGKNTGDSVRAGVLLGHAAAIERLIAEFEAQMQQKDLPILATGEEAEQILPLLQRAVQYDKDLAHRGLYSLSLLNEGKRGTAARRSK